MEHVDQDLATRDMNTLWHPLSQMQDYEIFRPLHVVGAKGAYLQLADGVQVIDGISSWWCKLLGHGHPRLRAALIKQAQQFEHVMLAHTTNDVVVALSEALTAMSQNLNKVCYASDGACVVEMAMKMSLHARQILNQPHKTKFMALAGAYHGETCGALSVSDLGLYAKPYQSMLMPAVFLQNIPYVHTREEALWHDCSALWPNIEKQLEQHRENLTAILIEPIIQGAAGMLIHSQDFIKRLRVWTLQNDIHLIADEIMTGFGRTGLPLACQHADIEPDFLCLGKSITGGWLPLSAMLTSNAIYDLFYADYRLGKNFVHSHTYAGNPLAAAVALECINVIKEENIIAAAENLEPKLLSLMQQVAKQTGKLTRVRGIGGVVAADMVDYDAGQRTNFAVYQQAAALGAIIRPIGETLYWMPPLNVSDDVLAKLAAITKQIL